MIKKCLTFVLVCSVALAEGGANCYKNYEDDWFNCEMSYYAKVVPVSNAATVEKNLIDRWFELDREHCDIQHGFDDNECERKRKLDALNADLTFSTGGDAIITVYYGCMTFCALQLLIPVWGETVIIPCTIGYLSVSTYSFIKLGYDFKLESGKISNARQTCGQAAGAKRDLCVLLKGNEARAKKAAQDSKVESIEKPAFQQKESCLRWATTTYRHCLAGQP